MGLRSDSKSPDLESEIGAREGSEIKIQERIRKSESKSLDLESEMRPKTDRKSGPKPLRNLEEKSCKTALF